jgi:beta-fructofuranosidase
MVIRLHDKLIWDFWLAQDGLDTHIFYLQAPRAIKEETLRHWNVSIGHAVSQDLIHWKILPDALAPSHAEGDWDDFTTWTGSILQHAGAWYMFYTGTNRAENGKIQRVGLAVSDDLIHWQRHPGGALIEADPRWYEPFDLGLWHELTWRDPFVFKWDGKFHIYLTARSNTGPLDGRGVIGHAISSDLITWEVCPPVTEAGDFGFMEVPQLVEIDGLWYLFFSVTHDKYAKTRLASPDIKLQTGTHYLVAEEPFGPFRYLTEDFLVGDEIGSLYAGRVICNAQGKWVFLAFEHFAAGKMFVGKIIDPLPLSVQMDRKLFVPHRRA